MRGGRRRAAVEAYLRRADDLWEAFLRAAGLFDQARTASERAEGVARLRRLHEGFKNLACPNESLSEQWARSEAMRHELAAREDFSGKRVAQAFSQTERSWKRQ